MAITAIIVSLLVLILVQKFTKNLIFSIISAVFTVFLFRFDPAAMGMSFIEPLKDLSFYKLIITVFLIYLFSASLGDSGDAEKFAKSSRSLFDDRTAMAFMPLLIGFLPMPGGAMFTAPIVKIIGDEQNYDNEYMMITNYWFRHSVEFFWPVYPAMFLLCSLSEENIATFSLNLFPVFLAAVIIGWLFINGFKMPKIRKTDTKSMKGFWIIIFIILTGVMILGFKIEGYLALSINVGAYFIIRRKYLFSSLKSAFKKYDVFFLLFLFFVYKNFLTSVNLTTDIANDLNSIGFNLTLLTFILPLLLGMATGITQSAVGIAAPLLLSMGANTPWLYFSAVAGVLLSPVHLCVVLTGKYYSADLSNMYRKVFFLLLVTGTIPFFTALF